MKDNSIVQEFISPRGKKASVFRFVYHTIHNPTTEANYAYKLRSKVFLYNNTLDTDKMTVRERATIDKEREWSFEINKLTGPALKNFEIYCKRLVAFMERVSRFRSLFVNFFLGVSHQDSAYGLRFYYRQG